MSQENQETLFIHQWQTYRLLVDNNYMGHTELYTQARRVLNQTLLDRPVTMVDLGCGDSSLIPALVERINLKKYIGIDLAQNALELASENMAKLDTECRFERQNLFHYQHHGELTNLIFSGFSVHHGQTHEKLSLLQSLLEVSKPGGYFLLIDAVREPGQSRTDYIDQIVHYFNQKIEPLAPRMSVEEHIIKFDFPEEYANLTSLAQKAGWKLQYKWQLPDSPAYPVVLLLLQKPNINP